MGISKTTLFTEETNQLATVAKALAHPARIAIIQHLMSKESCVTGQLVEEIGLAQPTVSQHLRELKNLGIIRGTIEGTSVNYCIDTEQWSCMRLSLIDFLSQNPSQLQNECC